MSARILLLITELLPAGAERIVFELATRLPPDRYTVEVASLRSPDGDQGDDGAVARDLLRAGVPVRPLRLRHKLDARGALRLAAELRRFRPDVVHAHLFHANLAARLLGWIGSEAKIVSTVHIVERRRLPARRLLERLTAGRDQATVCVSQAVAEHARRDLRVAPERLHVIPNGIDLVRFPPTDARARAAARAALDLPADAPVIGAVGRLDRQKGFDVLLAALAQLPPETQLVIAGSGPEESALRRQAQPLGDRVRFLGQRDDVPTVLAALDLFAMPSRWEGFGLSLAEALATGLPAVASAVDSLPEVLGPGGVLVPPDDPAALAAALARLLADPAEREHLSALAAAQGARFRVERMVSDYARLYDELLGELNRR